MSEGKEDIYDFNTLEDRFEAIDTLTRATAMLSSIDAQLAADLVKLTNTLMVLSQNETVQFSAEPQQDQQSGGNSVDLDDLTSVAPREQQQSYDLGDDEIIDVLTGQPIDK